MRDLARLSQSIIYMAAAAIPDRPPVVEDRKADCYLFSDASAAGARIAQAHIPRFAPGRDYLRVPSDAAAAAAADRRRPPSLVGPRRLRLHPGTVPQPALAPLPRRRVRPDHRPHRRNALAATHRVPGRRGEFLRLLRHDRAGPRRPAAAVRLVRALANKSLSPLPPLRRSRGTHVTVSARGKLWIRPSWPGAKQTALA